MASSVTSRLGCGALYAGCLVYAVGRLWLERPHYLVGESPIWRSATEITDPAAYLLFLVGAGFLVANAITYRPAPNTIGEPVTSSAAASPEARLAARRPLRRLFVVPESFGLVAGLLILAILIPTFMIMDAAFRSPARGLYVSIAKPLNGATPVVPGAEPPLVYVSANGKLFLNSRQISRSELPAAIRQELARRADPTVYVEGEPNGNAGPVIEVVGEIQSAYRARVVLVTPGLRKLATR